MRALNGGTSTLSEDLKEPVHSCLHELIEAQALRTPGLPAVAFEGDVFTYAELDRRANHLAHHLQVLGVGPDVFVGLLMERSLDMVVGILGILKAGGAYLPIDPSNPRDRVAFMLEDAGATIMLTQSGLLSSIPPGVAPALCLDTLDWTNSDTRFEHAAKPGPNHAAYVIFTSGSTGRPKGVCIEHRNIVNYVLGVSERLGFTQGMQHAMVSTIAADLGNTVVFPALATGGCLHVISQARTESQGLLAEYFTREKIDVLKIVPSHLAALQSGNNPEAVLREHLIVGGEASRLDWIERLRAMAPECAIVNHYGPTETTVGVLTYRVDGPLPATPSGTLPIGRPLPGSEVHTLDERGQPVEDGVQGELYIGGAGVGRGYLNRPDLTAEKFVADRFSGSTGARLYRTGDLVRRLPDGCIEFCGRIDHQVKIHGYRVELGEIEGALREQGGVKDAVVTAVDDGAGNKRLVAYVVPKRTDQPLWGFPSTHVLPDGATVAHLNRNETDYIYNEIFLLQAYIRHGVTIADGDCILDAGSNIGLFTVFASRLADDLRITSFEPNPAAHACLSANARAWGKGGVTCMPFGLSSENRTADLTFFQGMSLLSGVYADASVEREVVKNYVLNQDVASRNDASLSAQIDELIGTKLTAVSQTVQLRTLSSVIAELGLDRIDLLKVNVEKSELDVLRGLGPEDWSKIRQMVIEVDLAEYVEPITTLLTGHGYDVLVEQDPLLRKTELCYVYAIRPGAHGTRLVREQTAADYVRTVPPPGPDLLTPAAVTGYLKDRLPAYMVPSAFMLLDKLPLNANGKIDRSALPAVSQEQMASAASDFAPPRTETETRLAAIWSDVLNVEGIGLTSNFFDLGGHSLLAIKAASRIRDTFEVDIQIQSLFEHPTLGALAGAIAEARRKPKERAFRTSAAGPIMRLARRSAQRTA